MSKDCKKEPQADYLRVRPGPICGESLTPAAKSHDSWKGAAAQVITRIKQRTRRCRDRVDTAKFADYFHGIAGARNNEADFAPAAAGGFQQRAIEDANTTCGGVVVRTVPQARGWAASAEPVEPARRSLRLGVFRFRDSFQEWYFLDSRPNAGARSVAVAPPAIGRPNG